MKQHKVAVRNRYKSYLTTVHSLDTCHQFPFDEAQNIGQAQTIADRLFIEAIYSDDNSISRHIILDACYARIKKLPDEMNCTHVLLKKTLAQKHTNADELVSQTDLRKLHLTM